MKYIFCGYMFPDVEKDIKKMKTPPPVSGHKYMVNLLAGLIANGQDVTVLNTPRIRYFPHYPSIIIRKSPYILDEKGIGINVGFINLPLINYITRELNLKHALRKMLKKCKNETVILITFDNFSPVISSMLYARKKYKNVHLCAVIGDLYGGNGIKRKNILKKMDDHTEYIVKQFDAFGFVTKYMAKELGVDDKPFVVIEGMYTDTNELRQEIQPIEKSEKQVFYAGFITKEYGILHLLKAFSLIEGDNYKLLLAGTGDAVEEVKSFSKHDKRIIYLGYITPSEVERYQRSATVLVNPRTSDHDFVKYSFASKNMECLASGVPYIAHDLVCNPEEYGEYMQYPADESDKALAQKIVEICNLSAEERKAIGDKARKFILDEKNPQVQCKKIVDMMAEFDT